MNKYQLTTTLFAFFVISLLPAQHTFSIVAVDEATGEIGSAGASCVVGAGDLGGVIIISRIIPGRGAINAQATICIPNVNLNNGIFQMGVDLSPQQVLDWLYQNDGCTFSSNETRQYGIADFDANGLARTAAFTGTGALDYAGHRVGANYAIQGNILLGPQVLDSMEQRFLNTSGPLADRLMAAMQGANVAGADSRCLDAGTSSTSAFLQVYKADDEPNLPYLRINVMETETGVEPIDSLQALFDTWLVTPVQELTIPIVSVFPNPVNDYFQLQLDRLDNELYLKIYTVQGRLLHQQEINQLRTTIRTDFMTEKGLLIYQLSGAAGQVLHHGKLIMEK